MVMAQWWSRSVGERRSCQRTRNFCYYVPACARMYVRTYTAFTSALCSGSINSLSPSSSRFPALFFSSFISARTTWQMLETPSRPGWPYYWQGRHSWFINLGQYKEMSFYDTNTCTGCRRSYGTNWVRVTRRLEIRRQWKTTKLRFVLKKNLKVPFLQILPQIAIAYRCILYLFGTMSNFFCKLPGHCIGNYIDQAINTLCLLSYQMNDMMRFSNFLL